MEQQKRPARWRGWIIALVAVLAVVGIAYGITVAYGITFTPFSPPYPQIVGKNCGTISSGERSTTGDFIQAEQCLWNAYETCQSATLVYNSTGLDFTETHAVSVQKHGSSCSVSDDTQGLIEGIGHATRSSYQCAGMEQQASGLVILGCGAEGDIKIPAMPNQYGAGSATTKMV